MKCKFSLTKIIALSYIVSSSIFYSYAQTTTRYHETIQGGVAMIGNSHYLTSSDFGGLAVVNDIDGDATTTISSSSDLILPSTSIIEYAYLSVETGFEATPGDMTSVKFKVPGGSYVTLTTASTQFLSTKSVLETSGSRKYRQILFDVTDLIPSNGFVSLAAGGVAGRYFVADPVPTYPVTQRTNMGGWSLIVVYKNTNSLIRSITIADNWQFFGSGTSTINTDIANVQMPNGGTVQATVGVTGTYGDPALVGSGCPGCTDFIRFGDASTALTLLTDPVMAVTNDALNSTIGWAANNDVTFDGGPAIAGSYTARNPAIGFTPATYAPAGTWGSADYDSDIFSASGILPADGTVKTIRLQQQTTGNDWLVSGSYFISIEVAPVELGKSINPSTIQDGGTATYTFTLDNTSSASVNLTNVEFVDYLPSNIIIAATPNATNTCGGTVTAVPGGTTFSVSGINMNIGDVCTITIDITNVPGQLNPECGTTPLAFTNTVKNVDDSSDSLWPIFDPVCLIVLAKPTTIDFDGIDDYISRSAFLGNYGEATMMSWIKLDSGFDGGDIMGQANFRLFVDSNRRLKTYIKTDASSGNHSVSTPNGSAPILNENQWYHVSAIYDGAKGEISLKLNGDLVWENTTLTGSVINNQAAWNSDHDFEIGRNTENDNNYFEGDIYETRVYSEALRTDELRYQICQEIENNGGTVRGTIVPKDITGLLWSDLKLYYKMATITAGFTQDDSSSGVDGELFNITTTLDRTAPLPYVTKSGGNGDWSNTNNWLYGTVWDITGAHSDSAIVKISDDLSTSADHDTVGLIIDSGSTLEIVGDSGISNSWYFKLDGTLDLEGESQLVQTDDSELDITSAGKLERDQQGTADTYTYNYWSSPVGVRNTTSNNNSFNVTDIMRDGSQNINFIGSGYDGTNTSPIGIADYWIWKFANQLDDDYSAWQHVRSSGTILAGEGYTMKGPGSGAIQDEQNYVFTGKPNNGDINLTINAGNDYLVGNPYPSALDAHQFIIDNAPIIEGSGATTGTLYFWEHWGGGSHILAEYQGGYATYNLSGGTPSASQGTNDPDVSTGGTPTKTPGRYLPVSQGFFVIGEATGTINFNNGQRVFEKESASSVFMSPSENDTSKNNSKTSNNEIANGDLRMKLRIGLNSVNEIHRQLLVTVDSNATQGIDWGYDGVLYDGQMDDLYWMVEGGKYVIQGTNEITLNSILPLGIHTDDNGINSITIDKLENVDDSLEIFLHDKDLAIYHNLRASNYDIFLNAGEYLDRFEITFSNGDTLGINENELEEFDINYTNSIESIVLNNPTNKEINSLEMYNILGQIVFATSQISETSYAEFKIKDLSVGTYIIKVKTPQGEISKKVLVK